MYCYKCVCVCVCVCVYVGSCQATKVFYRQFAGYGKGVHIRRFHCSYMYMYMTVIIDFVIYRGTPTLVFVVINHLGLLMCYCYSFRHAPFIFRFQIASTRLWCYQSTESPRLSIYLLSRWEAMQRPWTLTVNFKKQLNSTTVNVLGDQGFYPDAFLRLYIVLCFEGSSTRTLIFNPKKLYVVGDQGVLLWCLPKGIHLLFMLHVHVHVYMLRICVRELEWAVLVSACLG